LESVLTLLRFEGKDSYLMLGRLRKRQKGLAGTMLALLTVGCLNLTIQPGLMAATLIDCHETSIPLTTIASLPVDSASLDSNCGHCPGDEPAVENHDATSLYICASMVACDDDVQQLAIVAAEPKSWIASRSTPLQKFAEPPACRRFLEPMIGAPPRSLNIQYCRFLI
jgi:hypothetical protein